MTTSAAHVPAVDEVLSGARMLITGLQHVLVMYAGAIAVPLVIGGAFRLPKDQVAFLINADLFACGIATLIQCVGLWRFGIRLPVMMGTSFVAVLPIAAMAVAGAVITDVFGAVIVAGLFTIVVAPFAGRLVRYFPPLVTGTVVTVIGVTLLRIGVNWTAGGIRNFGDPTNLAVALTVLVVIVAVNKLFDGFGASIAVLLGLAIGFIVALAVGLVDLAGVREADWFALVYPFRFGAPTFNPAAIASLCIVMIVVMVESTGMFLALGEICDRPVGPAQLARGLAANGLGTLIGGAFNAFAQTSFPQNVGLVGVTGVRSRWVAATAGAILIFLGLFPKMGSAVASIPQPVLGGATLVLFGMVAATGIRILARVDYASRYNLLIIAVSVAAGVIPVISPTFFGQLPRWTTPLMGSGITLATASAVMLNLLLNGGTTRRAAAAED
jgi:xanthine permease